MLFSEEELIAILKKDLSNASPKDLASIAKSIVDASKNWQEVDLQTQIQDKKEEQFLHQICERVAKNKTLKGIKLFFKH